MQTCEIDEESDSALKHGVPSQQLFTVIYADALSSFLLAEVNRCTNTGGLT